MDLVFGSEAASNGRCSFGLGAGVDNDQLRARSGTDAGKLFVRRGLHDGHHYEAGQDARVLSQVPVNGGLVAGGCCGCDKQWSL